MNLLERNARITACRLCPRLVDWREQVAVEKRKSFALDSYWGRPVPDFGDPDATRLIVGLAPAAHGANRTGQMFTGDRSGDFLYRSLHKAGAASLPQAERIEDGLVLNGVLITASCHCAPPDNKPTPAELASCQPFLLEILESSRWTSILCLGSLAWTSVHKALNIKAPSFAHLAEHQVGETKLVASYHPSQQNTFTGRLTEAMMDAAIARFIG